MTTLTCEFCNKVFPKKQNLNVHQKSARYCLKIQDQQKVTLAEEIKLLKIKNQELYAIIREKDTLIVQVQEEKEKQDEIIKQKDKDILDLAIHELTHTTCNDVRWVPEWKGGNHREPYPTYHKMMRKWAKEIGLIV